MGNTPESSDDSDMNKMTMMSLTFTNSYIGKPVLFEGLRAGSGGEAFGIFCLIFVTGFVLRGLIFLYNYLEKNVWRESSLCVLKQSTSTAFGFTDEIITCDCSPRESMEKDFDSNGNSVDQKCLLDESDSSFGFLLFTNWKDFEKDMVRLLLTFPIVLLSYCLMLVAMSFVTLYFFGVVLGISFSEVYFRRIEKRTLNADLRPRTI